MVHRVGLVKKLVLSVLVEQLQPLAAIAFIPLPWHKVELHLTQVAQVT
jgi:hypothetical protein